MELASRIQELRKKAGLSQEALAEMLGISRQALGKWESGASMPTLENLAQLAKIFHLSIDELITGQSTRNEEEHNPALSAQSIDTLLQRIEQAQPKRTPALLIAAVGIIGAALICFAVFFAIRVHSLGQQYDALTERIDVLASRPTDTAALYQQILSRLESEFTLTEPDQFYFDWELLGCDLQKQTMTLSLRATPREFLPDDTLSFLLSPTSGASDTLPEAIVAAASISEGQFGAQVEIPLCAQLDVYIQSNAADGSTKQEQAAQLYDLSTQFVPVFQADTYKFGYTTWNKSSVSFSGSPAVSLTPASSPAAPKPAEIECCLFYNDEIIFTKLLDLKEDFPGSDTSQEDWADAPVAFGTVTYYPDIQEIESKRFDYISGAEICWTFRLTDSAGNHYERTLTLGVLQ